MSVGATAARAQDAPPSGWGRAHDVTAASASATAAWLGAWSPLRPVADIRRGLLRPPATSGLLSAPPPRIGAFLLAGAPGAMRGDLRVGRLGQHTTAPRRTPTEVIDPPAPDAALATTDTEASTFRDVDRFGELRVTTARERGAFHRPLDAAAIRDVQASGLGWAPVGARGMVIGRVLIDREQVDSAGYTGRVAPYGSSPFVWTDSVRPPMQRTRARLEGALSLEVAGFGLGVAAGIDAREHNSVDVPLRRNGRATVPALVAGVERVLPWAGARVGTYYRWQQPVETNTLNPVPLPFVTAYAVQGFEEPFGLALTAGNTLFVRNESRATAVGGSADVTIRGTRVSVAHEEGERAEDQYRLVARTRPTDRWRATGHDTRVGLQRLLFGSHRVTVATSHAVVRGRAERADLRGIAFRAADTRSTAELDWRAPLTTRWQAAASAGATRLVTRHDDFVTSERVRNDATTPFATLEVARHFARAAVAVGTSGAQVTPSGAIPVASTRGPNYRRVVAPAVAYDAAAARAVGAWLTATVPSRSAIWLITLRAERVSANGTAPSRLQPTGARTLVSLSVGIQP